MSSVDSSSRTRPTRIAGLGLLGVSVAAMVMGVVSLFGGESSGQAANASQHESTSAAPPGSSTRQPSSTTTPAPPSTTTPGVVAPSLPVSTADQPATTTVPAATTAPAGGATTPTTAVRVYNNSTVKGLANTAGDDLANNGWNVVERGNYPNGKIATTTVYYREGTDEQSAARILGERFGLRVEPRFEGIADASAGVIVIVTNDYKGPSRG